MSLTLRRLTALEETKLQEENKDLLKQIKALEVLMKEDEEVYSTIISESLALKAKHAKPRASEIVEEEKEISEQDLLANDRSVIIFTGSGYIKRVSIEEFESQSRGGKGKIGARLSTDDDSVSHIISCQDHDSVLFVTDK